MVKENVLWGTLSGLNVTYLQRWCSAWADLLLADMALLEHRSLGKGSTITHRRSLWEAAVVAYGRLAVSDQKREIAFKDLISEVAGEDGVVLHERIMDWRHGHVAHRKRAEFEAIKTVFAYANSVTPTSLHSVLAVDAGPAAGSKFARAFQKHVKMMRDSMYELRIRPLATKVIEDVNEGRIAKPGALRPADDQSTGDRYIINQCLYELNPTFS
ncbi:hypothetical protein A5756_10575 [Mycobacterium sp. 852002-53434_SCH5985345]|uniref:hypothetical protein n=1 Tax=Mycobacterium sp. 852002-53434_SCH5985345 TaxID=1834107 RepID=UPI0007FD603E|nr:hypothetical protein [Mycobacterium sp. 852002-53434_SCH5985345]OBF56727.1 hypothetical protein A5756_10575 [Mycobacterium sp. 852002-53434_SCH5985345]